MLEETKYIDEIWNRYNEYMSGNIKNDFYETRVYNKENNMEKLLRTVAMFIFTIITTVGVVYAGIAIYNNYIKHSVSSEYSMHVEKDWVKENMKYSEDVKAYYSVIEDYQEYLKYKDKFKDMTTLKEEDFIDNFVVLVCVDLSEKNKMDVKNIVLEDEFLYIEFKSDSKDKKAKTLHTLVLSNDQYRNEIKLRKVWDNNVNDNIPLEKLDVNYSLNQAIKDGCIVFNNGKLVSENENKIYEFVEKSQKGEECFIRIVEYYESNEIIKIQDIQYNCEKYLYCVRKGNRKIKYEDSENIEIKLYESNTCRKLMLYDNKSNNKYSILKF